ncbi:hypothetical protein BC941DRAFT_508166 [Chlamydoabsidia padenii]|nr:hypothetical protein BC941DRAFT_508166 [Chlamydoabsidia padenii]
MLPIQSTKKRYYLGIAALFLVVCIWVTTSFITNNIFGEQNYERPFFITYYSTSTFILYLIPFLICNGTTETVVTERLLNEEDKIEEDKIEEDKEDEDGMSDGTHQLLTLPETIRVSASFCILWFVANYCTNASLAYTSVGSSTILSSMSGLFTLIFGVIFKVEQFHWIKMISVGVSLLGVILVSWSDQQAQRDTKLMGDLIALTGAVFYGLYTILLKRWIGDESRINMPTFFGFVGLINVVMLWPVFFILDWTGIEPFSWPSQSTLWILISLNAFIGTFLSDYLWLISMLMTSPLVVTLGITLTVPLALIGDIILKHILPGVQYLVGACLVVAGFFLVNIDSLQDDQDRDIETMEMIPSDDQV